MWAKMPVKCLDFPNSLAGPNEGVASDVQLPTALSGAASPWYVEPPSSHFTTNWL